MGGGGGGSGSIGDIKTLIDRAKDELRRAAESGRRNVFISFAYEDVSTVNLLRGQAKNENMPLEFNDWSVPEPIASERATYIKEKISERIAKCSVTVVFLSNATPNSDWVDWEIEESVRQGKHVIGVFPKDAQPLAAPEAIQRRSIPCVAWPDLAAAVAKLP